VSSQRKLIAGTAAVAVLAGGGAALAAIELTRSSPTASVAPTGLVAYGHGVGNAGLEGRLGGRGLGGGLGPGPDGNVGFAGPRMLGTSLVAAAGYLGLSRTALRAQLASGITPAQVARAQGKPVDGLIAAMVAAQRATLDAAVADGSLTQAQATQIEAGLAARLKAFANGAWPHGPFGGHDGDAGGGEPPPAGGTGGSGAASF
jgi:hypothetical protein